MLRVAGDLVGQGAAVPGAFAQCHVDVGGGGDAEADAGVEQVADVDDVLGVSIKAVAEWLGHTDPAFTLATYTHLMPSSDERTRQAIEHLYGRRPDPDGPTTAQPDTTGA